MLQIDGFRRVQYGRISLTKRSKSPNAEWKYLRISRCRFSWQPETNDTNFILNHSNFCRFHRSHQTKHVGKCWITTPRAVCCLSCFLNRTDCKIISDLLQSNQFCNWCNLFLLGQSDRAEGIESCTDTTSYPIPATLIPIPTHLMQIFAFPFVAIVIIRKPCHSGEFFCRKINSYQCTVSSSLN